MLPLQNIQISRALKNYKYRDALIVISGFQEYGKIQKTHSNTNNILFDCKVDENDSCLKLWNREN